MICQTCGHSPGSHTYEGCLHWWCSCLRWVSRQEEDATTGPGSTSIGVLNPAPRPSYSTEREGTR